MASTFGPAKAEARDARSGTVAAIASSRSESQSTRPSSRRRTLNRGREVGIRLGRQGGRFGGSRLVHAPIRHAVAGHELLADRPELGRMLLVGAAVAGRVELAVAAALASPEPGHAGRGGRIGPSGRVQHRSGDRPPIHPVLRPGDAPAVGREPVDGRAMDDCRRGPFVYAEVVPVDQEDEVGEPQPPGRVLGLVGRSRSQAALTLEHENLDFVRARRL